MRILFLVAACLAVCLAQQGCDSTVLWEDCMDGKVFQAPCSNGTITILYPQQTCSLLFKPRNQTRYELTLFSTSFLVDPIHNVTVREEGPTPLLRAVQVGGSRPVPLNMTVTLDDPATVLMNASPGPGLYLSTLFYSLHLPR